MNVGQLKEALNRYDDELGVAIAIGMNSPYEDALVDLAVLEIKNVYELSRQGISIGESSLLASEAKVKRLILR